MIAGFLIGFACSYLLGIRWRHVQDFAWLIRNIPLIIRGIYAQD